MDDTLANIEHLADAARASAHTLYEAIRHAQNNGYSYNELIAATRLPRGTIQNIVAGQTPRLTIT